VLTVTVADALFVVSATLVASTLQLPATAGAVYSPVALIAPQVVVHVTAAFDALSTVAVNCCMPLASSAALVGLIDTDTVAGSVNVAVSTSLPPAASVTACVIVCEPRASDAVLQGSAAEVAVLLTLPA
jgi:Mrp family chromosome partitioning ATPase